MNPRRTPGRVAVGGGDEGLRGDRSEVASPTDPHSELVPREKVKDLLRAMANLELIRLEKVGRYGWDAHWSRLQRAQARIQAISQELGL
jgi:hypothetical protein